MRMQDTIRPKPAESLLHHSYTSIILQTSLAIRQAHSSCQSALCNEGRETSLHKRVSTYQITTYLGLAVSHPHVLQHSASSLSCSIQRGSYQHQCHNRMKQLIISWNKATSRPRGKPCGQQGASETDGHRNHKCHPESSQEEAQTLPT